MKSFFVLLLFGALLWAQSDKIFIPLNMEKAYQNGTRSLDGKPGSNYWINQAKYDIDVQLEPATRLIVGHESILYTNNSPDTLSEVVIRLYQDIRRLGNQRDWPVDSADINHGTHISLFKINEQTIDISAGNTDVQRQGTNLIVLLPEPLPPAGKISLEIDWQYNVTHISNLRHGTYDSTSFFIGYWYPQIAVYDDIDGWDMYNYTGLQEFYNDFSDFDVRITVPQHFVVWATGRLQNSHELFGKEMYLRYRSAFASDSVIHIIRQEDLQRGDFLKAGQTHSWHFKAHHVPDFAFAASDHYLWDMTSLNVEKGRRVLISAAYKKKSEDFTSVDSIARESIAFYSQELPGVPFPYPSLTVFNGRGGMEYPMMVNDGSSKRWASTVHVTSHEICHTYFPFYMGTNERKYAWMDEGWATMLPFEIQNRLAPKYDPIARNVKRYVQVAGSELDIPMIAPTIIYGSNSFRPSYRNAAYNRPGTAYYLLQGLLGKELFTKALQEYIRRWNGRHPIPYDFFFTFNDVAGEDLSWFWKPWFYEFGYPDLRIRDVVKNNGQNFILIDKVGNLPVPVELTVTFEDSSKQTISHSIRVWQNGQERISLPLPDNKKILSIDLGNAHIPDARPADNHWPFK